MSRAQPSTCRCEIIGHSLERDRLASLAGCRGHRDEVNVLQRAVRASELSDVTVLLLGATGTGKQRLAEIIHALDPERSRHRFLTFNCATLTRELAESQLFGHEKGAFTGADQQRLGVFRAAEGGTLLLDEIGDLDLELQDKLLYVLQEKRLLPLGGEYEQRVNVRIIAATNKPLEQMAQARQFRPELYQRLSGVTIHLPPLRERPDDIDAQARHFLERFQAGQDVLVQDFNPMVLESLRSFPWEGNTRELERVIRETVQINKPIGPLVELNDLPGWLIDKLWEAENATEERSTADQSSDVQSRDGLSADPLKAYVARATADGIKLQQAVDEVKREVVRAALQAHADNRTQAAKALGISRRALIDMLDRFQLRDNPESDDQ